LQDCAPFGLRNIAQHRPFHQQMLRRVHASPGRLARCDDGENLYSCSAVRQRAVASVAISASTVLT
jgi:hypothetical protein